MEYAQSRSQTKHSPALQTQCGKNLTTQAISRYSTNLTHCLCKSMLVDSQLLLQNRVKIQDDAQYDAQAQLAAPYYLNKTLYVLMRCIMTWVCTQLFALDSPEQN
ncbi:Hypothetical_protein [Hexamita inflata]|uniref:Hypothetical_protein n=1 Tax=Hexamita inflata TaxID=28002 RepID=A0AA86Q428_9EUKA|nr:Hypothetical protein HINF_LOCUS39589 [Hexamita inflata]